MKVYLREVAIRDLRFSVVVGALPLGGRGFKGDAMTVPEHWRRSKRIPFGDVRRQLEGTTLVERSRLLEFVRCNVGKIRPQPDPDWLVDQMSSYLLQCVVRDSVDDPDAHDTSVHAPFEAARELVGWFNWRVRVGELEPNGVRCIVERIEVVFRNGDAGIRNRIETGFLEHVLETPSNRQYFAHWAHDPLLSESYTAAMRWGVAHQKSDFPNP